VNYSITDLVFPGFLFIVCSVQDILTSITRFDFWKLLWPFREAGGRLGHLNAVIMTLIILLIVRVMTKAKVVLKL
jgi:predicted acyltransferase